MIPIIKKISAQISLNRYLTYAWHWKEGIYLNFQAIRLMLNYFYIQVQLNLNVMESLKFTISKNSCRTEIKNLKSCKNAQMKAFNSTLKELAIILEDKGSKAIYYAAGTNNGFNKRDPMEFEKIWLEYDRSDADYEVELLVE
jgi:hypothetical protein